MDGKLCGKRNCKAFGYSPNNRERMKYNAYHWAGLQVIGLYDDLVPKISILGDALEVGWT